MSKSSESQPWVTLPISYLVRDRYKIAINIRELTTLTNNFSLKYVKGCNATLIKSYPKELSMIYKVVCTKADSDPAGHEVRIKLDVDSITGGTKLNDVNVRVACSCPAFLYWGAQWHLHQRDALEGQPRPLLQAPTEQLDKRNGYLICKHVKVVADRIIPSVTRIINDVARKKRVEEFHRKEEEDLRRQEEAKKKKAPKPKPKNDREGLDMGISPSVKKRTRPGVLN